MSRRKHRSTSEHNSDIDMTPMLDIVFIMLIFFIVTTSFVKESGIDVNRPTAKTAERKEQGNIIIAIKPNGAIWIDKRKWMSGQFALTWLGYMLKIHWVR